tara:strand:- start:3318 stop:4037 length:720 start_codon:yes stop_codon:yes gene_type:complete
MDGLNRDAPDAMMERWRGLAPDEKRALLAAADGPAGAALTKVLGEEFAPMIQRAVQATPDSVRGGNGASTNPVDSGDETPNVSPQEQQQYDQFVGNGMKLIFAEGARDQIAERIRQSDPIEGLAAATVMVVKRLSESAEAKGTQIPNDVLLHGGLEIMGNIAELAEAANVHKYSEDDIEQAMYQALDQYGTQELESGRLDKEGIAQDFQAMMEADQAGRIDEILPGIEEKARQIGGNGG